MFCPPSPLSRRKAHLSSRRHEFRVHPFDVAEILPGYDLELGMRGIPSSTSYTSPLDLRHAHPTQPNRIIRTRHTHMGHCELWTSKSTSQTQQMLLGSANDTTRHSLETYSPHTGRRTKAPKYSQAPGACLEWRPCIGQPNSTILVHMCCPDLAESGPIVAENGKGGRTWLANAWGSHKGVI